MTKELSFDDEIYLDDNEDDALIDSKIPVGQFARIIDEFEAHKDDFDDGNDEDIDLDSLGLH